MSVRYRDSSGNETIVSGLTPGGDIEAGAVAIRHATVSLPALTAGAYGEVNATFSDGDMPDTDYVILVDSIGTTARNFSFSDKTINGFKVTHANISDSASGAQTLKLIAWKIYSVQHAAQNAEDIANIKATIPSTASSTNKLATSNDVSSLNTSLGSRLDDVEDVIDATASITNKLVSQSTMQTAIDNVKIDVDDEIDATSENPVQNKVIKAKIDEIEDELASSSNEISAIRKDDLSGMHNYVRYPYDDGASKSMNGITFTEENGIITMNGTTTAQASYYFVNGQMTNYYPDDNYLLPSGNYILRVEFSQDPASASDYQVYINKGNKDDQPAIGTLISTWKSNVDKPFTVDYDGYTSLRIGVTLGKAGVTVNNVTVKVLIRRADDPDTEWKLFVPSNKYIYENSYGLLSKNFDAIYVTPKAISKEDYDVNDLGPGMSRIGPLCPNTPAPQNNWCDIITVRQSGNPNQNTWGYGYQIAVVTTTANQGRMYVRSINNGTWNAWKEMVSNTLTSTNITSNYINTVVDTSYADRSLWSHIQGRVCELRGAFKFKAIPSTTNVNIANGIPATTAGFFGYLTNGLGKMVGMIYNQGETTLRGNIALTDINLTDLYYFCVTYMTKA